MESSIAETDRILYQLCQRDAKTPVELAKCISRLLELRNAPTKPTSWYHPNFIGQIASNLASAFANNELFTAKAEKSIKSTRIKDSSRKTYKTNDVKGLVPIKENYYRTAFKKSQNYFKKRIRKIKRIKRAFSNNGKFGQNVLRPYFVTYPLKSKKNKFLEKTAS